MPWTLAYKEEHCVQHVAAIRKPRVQSSSSTIPRLRIFEVTTIGSESTGQRLQSQKIVARLAYRYFVAKYPSQYSVVLTSVVWPLGPVARRKSWPPM